MSERQARQRIARDPRASFLVEAGEKWAELKAVHLTGTATVAEIDPALRSEIEAEASRKYDRFRIVGSDMPAATAAHYASTMRWVRFVPDTRILSWDNRKLTGAPS